MDVNQYFALGDTISFNVYPSAILGTGFERVKVLAVIDAETAKKYADIVALHQNVYPTLPDPSKVTYKKYTDYYYIKIKLANGTETVVGLPWINMSTVVKIVSTTANFKILLKTPDDINNIVNLLNANGYYNVEVTTE